MKNVASSHVLPFRALIDACWKEKYTSSRFVRDLIAGITVGIIAIPLAMALAIGSGVAPQYGLYTSAVAGIVIALTGGSRFSVSGPTAAFVVILYPVSQQFGLAGLLVATLMSGLFLILFGLARFGRLIEYIPLSVTLGFTSGIGITIGTMQIKDFLGLQMPHVPEHYLQKVGALFMALPTANLGDAAIGIVTLGTLIVWPRLGIRLPGHLPALLLMVAWNMSEAHKVVNLLRRAPKDDIIVMLICMSLTVLFDMVIAISVGIVLASLLFMRRIAQMTRLSPVNVEVPDDVLVLRVIGPLFFAAAEGLFSELETRIAGKRIVVLKWDAVPVLDAGGLDAFQRFVQRLPEGCELRVSNLEFQPLRTMARAGVQPIPGRLSFYPNREAALADL